MANPKAPILFGVDPDEIWRYVPKAARPGKFPAFLLKAPSLAVTVKRDELFATRRNKTVEAAPGVLDEIMDLTGRKWSLDPLPDNATDEERAEYTEKKTSLEALLTKWNAAFAKVDADFHEQDEEIELRILAESVSGWEGLQSASGKMIAFDAAKGRLGEVLRGALRAEVIEAALAGTFVSEDDAEGLLSSPA